MRITRDEDAYLWGLIDADLRVCAKQFRAAPKMRTKGACQIIAIDNRRTLRPHDVRSHETLSDRVHRKREIRLDRAIEMNLYADEL